MIDVYTNSSTVLTSAPVGRRYDEVWILRQKGEFGTLMIRNDMIGLMMVSTGYKPVHLRQTWEQCANSRASWAIGELYQRKRHTFAICSDNSITLKSKNDIVLRARQFFVEI